MVVFKFHEFDKWEDMIHRRQDFIVRQSANDMIRRASRTATGVTRGGSLQKGFVPRDIGFLAASLVTSLRGSSSLMQSGGQYALAIGTLRAGDLISFRWTASYAARLHYGYRGTDSSGRTFNQDGWFWVDEALPHWGRFVKKNAEIAQRLV